MKLVPPSSEPVKCPIPENAIIASPTVAVPEPGPPPAFTVSGELCAAATPDRSSSLPVPCPANEAFPQRPTKSVDPAAEPVNAVIPLNGTVPPPLSPDTDPPGTDTVTPAGTAVRFRVFSVPPPVKV